MRSNHQHRRMPSWSELRPLVRMEPPRLSSVERHLARAASIGDLRTVARRRTPRSVFDYVDGAAEAEVSLHRARDAFAQVEFRPRVLRDVTAVDAARTSSEPRAACRWCWRRPASRG